MTPIDPVLRGSTAHLFRPGLDLALVAASSGTIPLDGDEHHLRRVLRVRDGESVTVSDGAGAWLPCRYEAGDLRADGSVRTAAARATVLTVAFAPVKGERTDWTVEKLVEVGVDRIAVLAPTVRSVVRWDEGRAAGNEDKLRRTVLAAASQCRRVWLPDVRVGVALADVAASGSAVADPDGDPIDSAAGDRAVHTLVVGPEGGFDPAEIDGWTRVSLGATVLRAETAAVVAGVLLVAHHGG